MRTAMPTQGTAPKRVTDEQVDDAIRSLDEAVSKLKKAVLRPDKSQSDTPAKSTDSER